ncbi:rhamnogalacturonan lyase [Tundrisphaera sp. TA3]|uniref:rhamnogalacturonan lyase n=1 Tax=Tundrisphaera sp. TA3 TaxID=3435775 RepID=UPI003EB8F26B
MRAILPSLAFSVLPILFSTRPGVADAPRRMERLGRGVVAIRRADGQVFVGWRLLGTDPDGLAFHVERTIAGAEPERISPRPLVGATCFLDDRAPGDRPIRYRIVAEGVGTDSPPGTFDLEPGSWAYLPIPLKTPAGYRSNDAAPGDLDGDGEYEFVVKEEMRGFDNSQRGVCPGTTKLAAYRRDGTWLWRIDLGKNIREGAHYTPFIVYDLDGDGRAEVAVRTAEGTVDGTGRTIGDVDGDGRTDHVDPASGMILEGPELLSIFDGMTGKELARTPYLPRGRVADWGDRTGNRSDRFLMGVGHFRDGRPSVLMCRGYYTITTLAALDWRGGSLSTLWHFDTRSDPALKAYEGQGNHNLRIGDVDGDGRDEVIYGAMALDHDGTPLYSTGLGHGDAIHLSDLDPDRPGLEVLDIHERPKHPNGLEFRDARTGALLWGKPSPDVGRGLAIDLDPRHRGAESWGAGPGLDALYDCKGATIPGRKPRSCNFAVWWDGDPLRELLDRTAITKWDWRRGGEDRLLLAENCSSNNGTKSNPSLSADILGDWREEVIWRAVDRDELRIYTTAIPTEIRLPTLMHDPIYRLDVAMQNVGYNLPPQVSFFLGDGMAPPPRPNIRTDPEAKP